MKGKDIGPAVGGDLVTAGGRVLNAVGFGPDLTTARAAAYAVAEQVDFRGAWYRHDIAEQRLTVKFDSADGLTGYHRSNHQH